MNLRQYYEETTKQENELIEIRKRLEEQISSLLKITLTFIGRSL